MGNIVLVHGAWAGPWCWDEVAQRLRERGHGVRVPELHRGSLESDTAAVQAEVDDIGAAVTVCGWSYGGAVITGLALPEGSRLVYIAAYMPDAGETVGALDASMPGDIRQIMQVQGGNLVLDADRTDQVLWDDLGPEAAAAARKQLRPQALLCMTAAPGHVSWRDMSSTYVVCTADRAVHPDLQRRLGCRATTVVEWDTSHTPLLSRPDLVVDLLHETAGTTPSR